MFGKLPCGFLADSESDGARFKKKIQTFPSVHFLLICTERVFHITDHTPSAMSAKTSYTKSLGTVHTKGIYQSFSQEHGLS